MSTALATSPILQLDQLVIRRNVFTFLGGKFQIFDMSGRVIATSKQAAFKLKEDIRVYSDEAMKDELLLISARQAIDFSASYDIVDAHSGEKVGAMRRRGLKSILKDEWQILDTSDAQVGTVKEDGTAMALLRRFLSNLIPQTFHIELGGETLGTLKQHFNPFVFRATLDLTGDPQRKLDRRLALGAVILLVAIEGRQD